jgi:glutamate-1-semialdehyde aminotransferase
VLHLQFAGPRFGLYFGVREPVTNYRQAAAKNHAAENTFIRACFERGVYFQPSAHHGFSAVHTDEDLQQVLVAIEGALGVVRDTQ